MLQTYDKKKYKLKLKIAMSLDIMFNKSISLEDIENKTTLKIKDKNNCKWLVDEFGNCMLIKENNWVDEFGNKVNDYSLELTSYGLNNPTKIMEELIKTFDAKFITDNELEILYYESENEINMNELFDNSMKRFGYLIDDKIVVPKRKDECYIPYENKFPEQQIENNDGLPF